jgi:3-hydroxyisobutyrate dehydrogenase-like beta-hydroxyacid dehydrogenase
MGMPMLARLRASSVPVRFHARRAEAKERARALGALDAGSLAGVAEGSEVVVVCVYSDDQVREVCLGPDGLLAAMTPGSVLVNHTTGSPDTPPLLAAAAPLGVEVLDAALSGGPDDVARGALTLLVGGDAEVLERARPALAAYSDPILAVGGLGDGQRVKLLNNALLGANLTLALEVERLAAELGVEPARALEAITHCSGATRVLGMAAAMGSALELRERAGRFIQKDVATVEAVARALGVDLGLLGTVANPGRTPTDV